MVGVTVQLSSGYFTNFMQDWSQMNFINLKYYFNFHVCLSIRGPWVIPPP